MYIVDVPLIEKKMLSQAYPSHHNKFMDVPKALPRAEENGLPDHSQQDRGPYKYLYKKRGTGGGPNMFGRII